MITKLIYKDYWRDGTIGTPSTEEPEFPATDTQEDTLKLPWRTRNDSETAYIPNDLGVAYEIDFVAILGHNIPVGATIKAIGADDAGFSVEVVEETITYYAENIFHFFDTSRTKRYWKIQVADPDNPDNYIKIGTIVLGIFFEPTCNFDWGQEEGYEDPSSIVYSDSEVLFAQKKPEMFAGDYGFESLSDADSEEIESLLDTCGHHKAFVICFDYDNPNTSSYWVKLVNVSPLENMGIDTWGWKISIIEVK